jgi:hypothetical protein
LLKVGVGRFAHRNDVSTGEIFPLNDKVGIGSGIGNNVSPEFYRIIYLIA